MFADMFRINKAFSLCKVVANLLFQWDKRREKGICLASEPIPTKLRNNFITSSDVLPNVSNGIVESISPFFWCVKDICIIQMI